MTLFTFRLAQESFYTQLTIFHDFLFFAILFFRAGLRSVCVCVTFVTLECARVRVWLSPSLRSVGASLERVLGPWLPERVVVVHIPYCTFTPFHLPLAAL